MRVSETVRDIGTYRERERERGIKRLFKARGELERYCKTVYVRECVYIRRAHKQALSREPQWVIHLGDINVSRVCHVHALLLLLFTSY